MFFEDLTFCELGCAFQKWVFGGSPAPVEDKRLVIMNIPTQFQFDNWASKRSAVSFRGPLQVFSGFSIVPDDYVIAVLTREFWENSIPQTAGLALRPNRDDFYVRLPGDKQSTAWSALSERQQNIVRSWGMII